VGLTKFRGKVYRRRKGGPCDDSWQWGASWLRYLRRRGRSSNVRDHDSKPERPWVGYRRALRDRVDSSVNLRYESLEDALDGTFQVRHTIDALLACGKSE